MAEHIWIQENLASYVAGGLDTDERDRLEQHIAGCETCARTLNETRNFDRSLDRLFVSARPTAELEDRMIQAMRAQRPFPTWLLRLAACLVVPIALGIIGSLSLYLMSQAELPFFHVSVESRNRMAALNNLKQLGLAAHSYHSRGDITQFDDATRSPTPPAAHKLIRDVSESQSDISTLDDTLALGINGRVRTYVSNPNTEEFGVFQGEDKERKHIPAAAGRAPTSERELLRQDAPEPTGLAAMAGRGGMADRERRALDETAIKMEVITEADKKSRNTSASNELYYSYQDAFPMPLYSSRPTTSEKLVEEFGGQTGAQSPVTFSRGTQAAEVGKNIAPTATTPPPPGFIANEKKDMRDSFVRERPTGRSGGFGQIAYPELKLAEKQQLEGKININNASSTELLRGLALREPQKKEGNLEDQKTEPARPPVEQTPPKEPAAALASRRIIRSGNIDFEIDSFDDATAVVARLVGAIPGGFIATINSEKLPNGKVRGSVVVRVPPERLDALLLDLRKELTKHGELKGQRIGSQDITKQYTDLESRLRAARAMEERLLQIIKNGKGEIKDLVVAEKELGVWRTRIEETEGELRYYANLVSLSTLTITLTEKEIRAAVGIVEVERVQMGIEVEDVEKAQREALAAVAAAKGRISKAELKQQSAGQYSALLHFSAAPEQAGPLRDRLKQLGTVARLDVDRTQQAEGGTDKPADGKVTHQDVQFVVSLYNVANIAPRETVHLQVAAADAEAAYQNVLAQVRKALGRVVSSDLSRPRNDQTKGTIQFEVKTADAETLLADLKQVGEVISLQVTENPDAQNVTRAKRGFQVQIWSLSAVAPRETTALQMATRDVPAGYRTLQQAVAQAKGRILNAQLNEQDRQNITAQLDFEIRRGEEAGVENVLNTLGDVHSRTVTRAPENETALDSKVRLQVKLINAASLEPRETVGLKIEVVNVEQTAAAFTAFVAENQGRVVQSQVAHSHDGQTTARLMYDVPLSAALGLVDRFKAAGRVRAQQVSRNMQVPEGKLSVARLDIALTDAEQIVTGDEGFWPQIRTGFQASFKAIAWSLTLVIIGICVVLPWAVVLYGVYVVAVRLRRRTPTAA